jgi:starvation-inducible outer membrane lipoprotein
MIYNTNFYAAMCYVLVTCVTLPTPLVDKSRSETSSAASYDPAVIRDIREERDSRRCLEGKNL